MPLWERLVSRRSPDERAAQESLKDAQRHHEAAIKAAEQRVRAVRKEHDEAVDRARKALQGAEKAQGKLVRKAEDALQRLRDPGSGKRLASYQGITLYEHQIKGPKATGPTAGAQATVDTAGNVYSKGTLMRSAVSLGTWQKKKDDRELWLAVETSETSATVIACPLDEAQKARQFVAEVRSAAVRDQAWRESLPSAIDTAAKELAARRADTTAVDEARAVLQRVTDDPEMLAGIKEAERQLDAARADTQAVEAAAARVAEARPARG